MDEAPEKRGAHTALKAVDADDDGAGDAEGGTALDVDGSNGPDSRDDEEGCTAEEAADIDDEVESVLKNNNGSEGGAAVPDAGGVATTAQGRENVRGSASVGGTEEGNGRAGITENE